MNIEIIEKSKSITKISEFVPGIYHNAQWILIVPTKTEVYVSNSSAGFLIRKDNIERTCIQNLNELTHADYRPFYGSVKFEG